MNSYWLLYLDYLAYYNTRRAFVIIFLICSDLLNCLRSVGTIVITTESGLNSLKVIFTKQFLTKTTIFRCFDVFFVRPPQIFQVQAKISTIRPVCQDCLSDYALTYDLNNFKSRLTDTFYYNVSSKQLSLFRFNLFVLLLLQLHAT